MKITTEPTVEITECPKGCGESVSLTMIPTGASVKVGEEFLQIFVPSKTVHLNGFVQCAKKCNSCGESGYMKHVTTHKRTFLHTATHAKECSK